MAEIDPAQDGQLEVKKRARRRLVGAVALALLAVIVLPMVMDQAPKPLTQDIEIRIPSQDAGAFGKAAPAALPSAPAANPVKPDTAPPTPAPASASPPKVIQPAQVAPQTHEAPPAKPAAVPEPAAKPEGRQWILQLGAYRDPANVRQLQAKLKELGYPSYTEKVDTAQGQRTRVRGGPFSTRAAAEKAQARMKKIGAGGPPGGVVAQKP